MSSNAAVIQVTIDESEMVNGSANCFDLSDVYQWSSPWGIPDLRVDYAESGTALTMGPCFVNDTNAYWFIDGVPQKKMETFNHKEITDGSWAGDTVEFSVVVTSNTLTAAHECFAYIRDFDSGYGAFIESAKQLTTNGTYTVTLPLSSDVSHPIQYGVRMYGVNVWETNLAAYGLIYIEAVAGDIPPPDPDFAIEPVGIADNKISMSSTTVEDDFSSVEYYFDCLTPGGHDSGWQSSTNYVDTGLIPNSNYTYTVQARDTSANTNLTAVSAPKSATTKVQDNTAPEPDPMTFDIEPTPASPNSVYMKADLAIDTNDITGVEYYFACTSTNGTDSGWQSSPEYLDWNLPPSTEFSYAVTARDTSSQTNMTIPSGIFSATTPASKHWMVNSLKGYTGDSTQLETRHALGVDSLEITDTTSANQAVVFNGSGVAFGTAATDIPGRNVLRTTEVNYNESSFDAYATFAFNASTQHVFIGFGGGVLAPLDVGWGVPDLNAVGVDGVFAEFTGDLTKMWRSENGATPGGENLKDGLSHSFGSHRIQLAYDAVAETATVMVDLDYADPFVADHTNATLSTTGLWAGEQECRVYIGGDNGVVFSDLVIKNSDPDPVEIAIAQIPEGSLISWDGEAAQTYDVQYKTDLIAATSWTPDPSQGCTNILATVSGTMSATSTVSATETKAFYQVISK